MRMRRRAIGGAVFALALGSAARAQEAPPIITNGTSTGITTPSFLFEPEVPMASLKEVPTWSELEQLLDNPYRVALCSSIVSAPPLLRNTPLNEQGFRAYCTDPARFTRRQAFGVTLPPLLVHALNSNPTTGEEMRLVSPLYPGGDFDATGACVSDTADPCTPEPTTITVSPGEDRFGAGESQIDYNSPFARDVPICILSTEMPEGVALCGGDPGEPGYRGFGVLDFDAYSTPAVPLLPGANSSTPIPFFALMFDPDRGFIFPRSRFFPSGGLHKPSLQVPEAGGTPGNPNFLVNSDPNNTLPSNENDYIRDRVAATQLGKALFWDMQVGSDGVQSCGTCHFAAGVDPRTKNQVNPDHLGPLSFGATFDLKPPNSELTVADFPLHKLADPNVAGDPACTTPITANINPGVLENNFPAGVRDFVVCNAANVVRDSNDVVSSMGVHFGLFQDIPVPGTLSFGASSSGGVRALLPDLRVPGSVDPIAGFAGVSGNDFRRVEPRNTPTIFGAAFNFDNFWDGRARHEFNGGSVFGASDPQPHVFVARVPGQLAATRQLIKFSSLASLATGPALSEFEMSFQGRNWAKLGKKLLQGTNTAARPTVTPLANQLVAVSDSVLGPWSNQGGSGCASLPAADRSGNGVTATGKPGLCISYAALIRRSFYPQLWQNTSRHLNGTSAVCTTAVNGTVTPAGCDPFDGYTLAPANGPASFNNTNEFTQAEANFSLFFGLSVQAWVTILVADNTPLDQVMDRNPDAFLSLGEPGEPGLVPFQVNCTSPTQRNCFREVGLFKRDTTFGGTRTPSSNEPDPLLGLDLFEASNLSGKNPNFRSARCGECHAMPTLTDHTTAFTFKTTLRDFGPGEFITPGNENTIEPMGRMRVISGFLLESELNENGQDAVEKRMANQSIVPNPADGLAYPDGLLNPLGADGLADTDDDYTGAAFSYFDNGIYNLGIRPIAEDVGRGGTDAFGWPLSLAAMLMKNLGGIDAEPGVPLATFSCASSPCDPVEDQGGGLFEETLQDQGINPGLAPEPIEPLLPPYLAPYANDINVSDTSPELDEVDGGLNTLTDIAVLEGFLDTIGPFNPAGLLPEALNNAESPITGTWPVPNRVMRMGGFKAAQLRGVELSAPYFHNGGLLTLRQVVDFYARGGDFPVTNAAHRDFNIVNQTLEVQSNLTEEEKVALVDFLLTLTDDRVRFERAPFDRPQVIVPLDGRAPDNTGGRDALLATCTPMPGGGCATGMFRDVPAVGASGTTAVPSFLGIAGVDPTTGVPLKRLVGAAANCPTVDSHYCR